MPSKTRHGRLLFEKTPPPAPTANMRAPTRSSWRSPGSFVGRTQYFAPRPNRFLTLICENRRRSYRVTHIEYCVQWPFSRHPERTCRIPVRAG